MDENDLYSMRNSELIEALYSARLQFKGLKEAMLAVYLAFDGPGAKKQRLSRPQIRALNNIRELMQKEIDQALEP